MSLLLLAWTMDAHYRALGVPPSAAPEEIKAAFVKAALKFHPDRLLHATEAERRAAAEKFQARSL